MSRGGDSYHRKRAEGRCTRCGQDNDTNTPLCTSCRKIVREKDGKRTYARFVMQREQVFDHYGRECACCGEDEPMFLQIDHINNDGNEERGYRGHHNLYHHIIKAGFPDDLQVLCANCNHGKHRNGGICPHKTRC